MRRPTKFHSLHYSTALAGGLALALAFKPSLVHALPQGGQVAGGQADITVDGSVLTVSQSSARAVLNWNSFDVAGGEKVQFDQPSSTAIALNRVHDIKPSQIDGSITANGQVWLINPSGVIFGQGAQVDVGGLLATTSDIDNDRFMAGDYRFDQPGNADGAIRNAGAIRVAPGGLAAFAAAEVTNTGLIEARLGKVQLASGDIYAFDLHGDGLINLQASPAMQQQLVSNSGAIMADGGSVLLTAALAEQAVGSLINMDGIIRAASVGEQNGEIVLYAEGSNAVKDNIAADKGIKSGSGTVLVSGVLDASGYGEGETGGAIEVLGDNVGILNGSLIDASGDTGGGTIHVGGEYQGKGTTATADTTLVEGGVTLKANATGEGDGGEVILWADDATGFYGDIEAKGGTTGGDGGFVETSGKRYLDARGSVNTLAAFGDTGLWLLDPTDITISTAADTGTMTWNGTQFEDTAAATSNLNVTTLQNQLATTNVLVTTASGLGGTGNMTVSNAITWSSANSLTLFADNNLRVNANITYTGGSANNLTLQANNDVVIASGARLTATGAGALDITLNSNRDAVGAGAIVVSTNSILSSNGGDIVLGGGADPTAAAAIGSSPFSSGIYLDTSTIDAEGGNISILGQGGDNSGNENFGVLVWGATVQTSGAGTIDITGTGGGNTNSASNHGIYIRSNGTISAEDGTVTVEGTGGGAGSGGSNYGTYIWLGTIRTVGTGEVHITGTGGSTVSGTQNYGVVNSAANGVQTTGGGDITIDGTGGSGSGGSSGILMSGTISGSGGTITLTGDSNATAGNSNAGVNISGTVSGNGGHISVTGTGGNSSGNSNHGVVITSANGINNTGSGTVTVTGFGGGNTNSAINIGVYLLNGNISLSTVDGLLTVEGTGGGGGSGTLNNGIYLNGTAIMQTTGAGGILARGWGGNLAGSGGTISGIATEAGSTIRTTGGGTITLEGTGGSGSGATNAGISVAGAITGSGGLIDLTGTGSNSSGNTNYGVFINGAGGSVTNTGSGGINITGTGGGNTNSSNNYGIYANNGGVVSAADGNVTVIGTGGGAGVGTNNYGIYVNGANSAIRTTGTGDISISGVRGGGAAASNYGLSLNVANAIQTSGSGDITVRSDFWSLANAYNINSIGDLTIAPYTSAETIGIAGSAGTLNISTTYLGYINAGNGFTLTIGRSDGQGLLRATGYNFSARDFHIALLNGSANIQFDGGGTALTLAANKTLNIATSSGTFTTAGTGSIITSGIGDITIDDPLALGANLTLTSADTISFGGTVNGGFDLTGSAGAFSFNGTWGGSIALDDVSLTSTNSLVLSSITAGSVFARSVGATSDLTLAGGAALMASKAGTAITLAAGDDFHNNAGAGAFSTPSGRWLIYSETPSQDTKGGLTGYTKRYNKTYASYDPASVVENGNVWLYSVAPTLTVTADNKSKTYGSVNPGLTYQVAGLLDGDTAGDALSGSITTAAATGSVAGAYAITQGTIGVTLLGYSLGFTNGTLTINKATLTVAAEDKTRQWGQQNPPFTASITGFVNGDDASVVSGSPTLTSMATVNSGEGSYAITPALGTLAATNYDFSFIDGHLTVTGIDPSVTTWTHSVNALTNPLSLMVKVQEPEIRFTRDLPLVFAPSRSEVLEGMANGSHELQLKWRTE